ncbi:hypothetical protein [Xanthomonas theicola]|uniref:hypothetical protein n=1 Tax=Xanthomonas theicola TaxID=56464 RepID=UPI00163B3DBC|nr:hypothetical protein [Xanthomonas theicola]QNH24314.1 hypothetical protein G4Q83_05525 [Xanthomonas theicola]
MHLYVGAGSTILSPTVAMRDGVPATLQSARFSLRLRSLERVDWHAGHTAQI